MADKNIFACIGRMLKAYFILDVVYFTRDLKICILQLIADAAASLAAVVGMFLLSGRLADASGFTRQQLLFMLGIALLADGVYALLFFNNNAGAPSRIIGRGQLDHNLIQPVPLPVQLLTWGIAPVSGCGPFICGLIFTGAAASSLPPGTLAPLWGLKLAVCLLLSVIIITAWVWIISCIAFWAPYAAEEISTEVTSLFTSLAAYPLSVLAKGVQLVLCGLLPVGAVAWLPANIVFGTVPAGRTMGFISAVAAMFSLLAILIFRKGLKYYAKFSSPRYSGFGR